MVVSNPVFADVAVGPYDLFDAVIEELIGDNEEIALVIGMVMIAVIIAIVCAVAISKKEANDEKSVDTEKTNLNDNK